MTSDGALWMSIGTGLARIHDGQFVWMPVPIDRTPGRRESGRGRRGLPVIRCGEDGLYRVNRATGASPERLSEADGLPAGMPTSSGAIATRTIWLVIRSMWKGATGTPARQQPVQAANTSRKTAWSTGRRGRAVSSNRCEAGNGGLILAGGGWDHLGGRDGALDPDLPAAADGRFLPPGLEVYVGAQGVVVDRHGSLWIPSLGDGLRRVARPQSTGNGHRREMGQGRGGVHGRPWSLRGRALRRFRG